MGTPLLEGLEQNQSTLLWTVREPLTPVTVAASVGGPTHARHGAGPSEGAGGA